MSNNYMETWHKRERLIKPELSSQHQNWTMSLFTNSFQLLIWFITSARAPVRAGSLVFGCAAFSLSVSENPTLGCWWWSPHPGGSENLAWNRSKSPQNINIHIPVRSVWGALSFCNTSSNTAFYYHVRLLLPASFSRSCLMYFFPSFMENTQCP